MPKVLVLLASYNGAKWLPEQCDSILKQVGVEVRLVASDDCSSDRSHGYLLERQSFDARIEVLPLVGRAGSAGKNFYRLIRDADLRDCEFVAFADQDDIWHPDKLMRGCEELASLGKAGYSSAVRAFYDDGRSYELRQSPRVTPIDFMFEGAGQGCTFVLSRSLFEAVQQVVRNTWEPVCKVHHHDWMVYALCRSWKLPWHFDPLPSMDYRQHQGNELGARSALSGIAKRWGMIRSGWYSGQVEAVANAIQCAGSGPSIADFARLHRQRQAPRGRLAWVLALGRVGRRKSIDRFVLVIAAILGYV